MALRLGFIGIVTRDMSASLAFYRMPFLTGATSRMSIPGSRTASFWHGTPSISFAVSTLVMSRPREAIASPWLLTRGR